MDLTGEIYVIINKINNKCYVGQAKKHVGKLKLTWGTTGRWKSHVREALNSENKGQKDHCVLLNQAIRKYGVDSFEVRKLEDVTNDNIDEREIFQIKQFNSLVPNGYYLNHGGARGKDSDETREKKKQMRLNKHHSDDVKAKISKGQLGNRRGKLKRKYPEDDILPKYIVAKRIGGVVIGYILSCFPIGTESKKYISKSFINQSNPEESLKKAQEMLETLQEKYAVCQEKQKEAQTVNKEPPKLSRASRSNKKGSDKYNMPKYISLITLKDKEVGFLVDGLRLVQDDETIKRYTKSFTDPSKTMDEKLSIAIQHLQDIQTTCNCI